jgi:hypothetical protein
MNSNTTCGPGDPETWPTCDGHPHDPRTPESDDDPTMDVIAEVRGFLRLAEIDLSKGRTNMAKNALIEAMLSIQELVGEKS